MSPVPHDKPFTLAGRTYQSRLLVGTGKYKDLDETRAAIEASGAEIEAAPAEEIVRSEDGYIIVRITD